MRNGQDFIKRLQGLSEFQKKIIVWGITILLGISLLAWWIPRITERIRIQQGPSISEQFQIQELQEQLQDIPIPTLPSDIPYDQ